VGRQEADRKLNAVLVARRNDRRRRSAPSAGVSFGVEDAAD